MKLIILGLDALNHQLIESCKAEMPTLYRHLKEDTQGLLKTTLPYYTGPTWTSLQTGKNIGNHGMANFFKYESDLKLRLATGKDVREKTFYELLHEQSKKCFIMNLPYTYPPKIPGDLIYSWLYVYDKVEELFWPANLLQRYPSLKNYKNRADRSRSVTRYLNTGLEVLKSQEAAVKEVLSAREHDVYFLLLAAADMVQHKLFEELIKNKNNKQTKIAKEILHRLDDLVKWIDEQKDPETVVLIASDHGFQMYEGKFFVNSWLKNKGYLKISQAGQEVQDSVKIVGKKRKRTLNLSKLVIFVKKHPRLFKLSELFYDFVANHLPFEIVKQPKIDFKETKAFCRSIFEGIIFLNEQLPLAEKERLKKEILHQLNLLPGLKAYDCQEFYRGKYVHELGDIKVTSEQFEIDNTIGATEYTHFARPMHSLHGIFMAYGPGIKKAYSLRGANIWDVMPTILHLLKTKIPADLDGTVLTDIFEPHSEFAQRGIEIATIDRTTEEKEKLNSILKGIKI